MANLYGIESKADCRERIDELLQTVDVAKRTMNKKIIADLKSDLKKYYKQQDYRRMSEVERAFFWPAIQGAYVRAPNLARPQTRRNGLDEIELNLKYYRPGEKEVAPR